MALEGPLTDEQYAQYQSEGYVVVEDLIPSEKIAELRERIRQYSHGEREATGSMILEEEPRVTRGELSVDHPGDGLRKIMNIAENDDLFRSLARDDRILGAMQQLLGQHLKLHGSMVFAKPPEVGGAKGVHQDAPYWPIRPMNLVNMWMPIDESTTENGCMMVSPGRHKNPLPHEPNESGDDYVIKEDYYDEDNFVKLPMEPGSALFMHTLLPHATDANTTDEWRRALSFRVMSARCRYMGDEESPEFLQLSGEEFPGCVR